jgi:hypothetical protein
MSDDDDDDDDDDDEPDDMLNNNNDVRLDPTEFLNIMRKTLGKLMKNFFNLKKKLIY